MFLKEKTGSEKLVTQVKLLFDITKTMNSQVIEDAQTYEFL